MGMKKGKKERLEAAGWRVGTTADFLGLSKEEAALIEMKLGLAASIRRRRIARKLTQTQLARRLGSSQSRVAKMEAADSSVSIDLLVRALLELGATRSQVAKAMAKQVRRAA
jgi:predicted transcriptional regulator